MVDVFPEKALFFLMLADELDFFEVFPENVLLELLFFLRLILLLLLLETSFDDPPSQEDLLDGLLFIDE
ncbi:hypothetical protein EF87_19760 [Bacillus amyloliquefaciens]|nr:hypothetical protein EF87_19760 [Bacillus amyloliquefaciens]